MTKILNIFLLLLCVNATANAQIMGQIRQIWDNFETAWEAEDAAGCAEFFAEDGVNIPPDNRVIYGREQIATFYQTLFDENKSSTYTHVIDSLGTDGETLMESGHFTVDWVSNEDKEWTFEARSLTQWEQKANGRWFIKSFIFSVRRPEE